MSGRGRGSGPGAGSDPEGAELCAGIGMGAVINSTHFGAAGAYALAAANAGLIGFVTCNSGAFVVPGVHPADTLLGVPGDIAGGAA